MEPETPSTAFTLTLISGVLILSLGIVFFALVGSWRSMMGDFSGMVGGYPGFVSMAALSGVWGIACGAVVLAGAYLLSTSPASHGTWGATVLIFSLLSLFEGGEFILGAILGITGGILAITWKPSGGLSAEGMSG